MFKLNNYYLYRNHDNQDNKRPPCYHTNNGQGTGLGKGGDNRGSRGLRHDTSRAFGIFFFYLLFIYQMFILHLELLQWRRMATTTTAHHLNLHNEHRLETQLCLKFWYVNFFLYCWITCMELQPGWQQQMATTSGMMNRDSRHHLHLKSLVVFFFFYYSSNLPWCVHHHHYHPQQQELKMQGKFFFFLTFSLLF